jgi:hypothetical protein
MREGCRPSFPTSNHGEYDMEQKEKTTIGNGTARIESDE